MKPSLLAIALLSLLAGRAGAVPVPEEPTGPSPEATKQIEARRAGLQDLQRIWREKLSPEELAELDRQLQPRLDQLAAALEHRDPFIYEAAVHDLVDDNYRAFAPDKIHALLLSRLKKPETNSVRISAQILVIRCLPGADQQTVSRAALPDLVRILVDTKVDDYLREEAIRTAVRIAPGDPVVVEGLIAALDKPNPPNSRDIRGRVIESLGKMGKAAAPARKALSKLFEPGKYWDDDIYLALGKIEYDENPKKLTEYVARLGQIDTLPIEQSAAAFLHIVELGRTGTGDRVVISADVASAARPTLLAIVAARPDDVHWRAALRALSDLGAGSQPGTAKLLVGLLLKYHDEFTAAWKKIEATEPGSQRNEAFFRLAAPYGIRERLLVNALAAFESDHAEVSEPIAEAFARFARLAGPNDWVTAQRLARILARFGTGAWPAVPAVIQGLRVLPVTTRSDVYPELFRDYLAVLAAAGGNEPGARRAVLDHLDPAGPTLTQTGPNARNLRVHLLLTLARLGLPTEAGDRTTALSRLREGLASDRSDIFSAATKVVASSALSPEEAGPVVKALLRVLEKDFQFQELSDGTVRQLSWAFTNEEMVLLGPGLAVRALGAIGPRAREALPAVRALAGQPLQKREDYRPEPAINLLIREGRKAEKQIDGTR
jgi:hypothetical protein